MFDVIPRWALALGIGTISAASVGTLAFETLGSNSACVETNSAVMFPSTELRSRPVAARHWFSVL